jgi:hypothetical protein
MSLFFSIYIISQTVILSLNQITVWSSDALYHEGPNDIMISLDYLPFSLRSFIERRETDYIMTSERQTVILSLFGYIISILNRHQQIHVNVDVPDINL